MGDDHHDPSMRPAAAGTHGAGPPAAAHESAIFAIDVNEYGAEKNGVRQQMDRRLFMQLQVYAVADTVEPTQALAGVSEALRSKQIAHVIYEDFADPRAFGLLTWSENPGHFLDKVRPVLAKPAFAHLQLKPNMTMVGRTYSSGYEQDLEFWMIKRPAETVTNAAWPWAIWYPLRRGGAFEMLEPREQGRILKEHAIIGRAYGAKDLAHDIRLACHGLDTNDNDFVIGLVGANLHPLSHVVQSMRKTRQTREFLERLGPFFVGRVVHQFA